MAGDVIQISSNRRFKFNKRTQLFIRTHNEMPIVAVSVRNPDFLPARIHA